MQLILGSGYFNRSVKLVGFKVIGEFLIKMLSGNGDLQLFYLFVGHTFINHHYRTNDPKYCAAFATGDALSCLPIVRRYLFPDPNGNEI